MTESRKRIVIHKPGSHDALELVTDRLSAPSPNEVTIAVKAAGVNYADCIVRMGLYSSAKELVGYPITPGFEVSGEIIAVGADVRELSIGQRVIAATLFGGYASHVNVPATQVFPLPAQFTYEEGAATTAVFLTAYFALDFLAHPRATDKVLVHSAAGGVGSTLVQLLKARGCTVVGVVGSTHKVEYAKALGADVVIDKSRAALWPEARRHAPNGYDVVLDANGVETLAESYRHLALPGKLVVYGFATMMPKTGGRPNYLKLALDYLRTPRFNPLDLTNRSRSIMAFNLSYLFERQDILREAGASMAGHIADGSFRPPTVTTYALERASQAHSDIESGQTVGKLVLLP